MPSDSPGLFAVGKLELFAVEVGSTVALYSNVQRNLAYLTDEGTGFLSKGLAILLSEHIKEAIDTEGGSIHQTYKPHSEVYMQELEKLGKTGKLFKYTETLYKSIGVINRRYSGGRGHVAGIDGRKKVPRLGWGGTGMKTVKIEDYVSAITFGYGNIPARPVIPQAIEHFMSTLSNNVLDHFWNKKMHNWEKDLNTEAGQHGDSLAKRHTTGSTAPTSVVGNEDLAQMSHGSGGKRLNFDKKEAKILYDAAIAAGESAKAARKLIEGMQTLNE